MQYKIPVHIENEDPIIFWLWLKQLSVIMWGFWIAYWVYNSLEAFWQDIATIPAVIIVLLWILIAVFKQYEMTFLPFLLSILRFNINFKERHWVKWVDNYSPLDFWNITMSQKTETEKIDIESKLEKIKNLENSLDKL